MSVDALFNKDITPEFNRQMNLVMEVLCDTRLKGYGERNHRELLEWVQEAVVHGWHGLHQMKPSELIREYQMIVLDYEHMESSEIFMELMRSTDDIIDNYDQQRCWDYVVAHASLVKPDFKG